MERRYPFSVQTLIDGWREADAAKAGSVLHENFRLVSFHYKEKDAKVGMNTRQELLDIMKKIKPGEWDDRLKNTKVTFSDTSIADVWTEFEFYSDGKISHCGIESFQLYRIAGSWQIINFADSTGPCS
jgi:hypothetical protein